jgi:hypothetical protein
MKKFYLQLSMLFLITLTAITVKAQGTWKADSTLAKIKASTEIDMKISNLKCMHSDTSGVIGKGDVSATNVDYNGITYDNKAFIQGSINGMYYAFRPQLDGKLDISVKMSGNKKTFIIELTDACPNNSDLAALTTNNITANAITGDSTYFTTPQVYDTDSKTNKTWNGTVAPVAATTYMVFSWDVKANKTYIAGCFGSKMMLRGVNYKVNNPPQSVIDENIQALDIYPNPAMNKVIIKVNNPTNISIYSAAGVLIKQQLVTSSDNIIDISGIEPGVYFIRDMNNIYKTQKLFIK